MIITECETAVTLIQHLRTQLKEPNIIFLDLFICQALQKSEIFHLPLFRLEVSLASNIPLIRYINKRT